MMPKHTEQPHKNQFRASNLDLHAVYFDTDENKLYITT